MATIAQELKKKEKLQKVEKILKGTAGEPTTTAERYKLELSEALTWYNIYEDVRKMRKWLSEYLLQNGKKEYIKYVDKGFDTEVQSMCVVVRLMARGQYVADKEKEFIDTRLEYLKQKFLRNEELKKDEEPKTLQPIVTVEQRIIEAAKKHMAEFDNQIDLFVVNKENKFLAKDYLLSNSVSGVVSKKIGEFYNRLYTEIQEAILGTDEQLIEAYSNFSKTELKKFCAFVKSIVDSCEQQVVSAKVIRAPRAKKAKPAGVQVAKLQYLKEFAELNLKSVVPTTIVGAQQVWVYNVKSKKLGVYYASSSNGFSVKGTSLMDWDPENSKQNSLRKPAITIKEVLEGGKVNLNKIHGKLTTVTTKMNGRINADTILLRVL